MIRMTSTMVALLLVLLCLTTSSSSSTELRSLQRTAARAVRESIVYHEEDNVDDETMMIPRSRALEDYLRDSIREATPRHSPFGLARRRGGSVGANSATQSVVPCRVGSTAATEEEGDKPSSSGSFWPPWPISLLTSRGSSSSPSDHRKKAVVYWHYFRVKSRQGFKHLQHVGSEIGYHLPPAAPPLILLALLPSTRIHTTTAASKRIVATAFARNMALASLGVSVLSWAHYEVYKKKNIAPLPLHAHFRDFKKALLPPFLPEALTYPIFDPLDQEDSDIMSPMGEPLHDDDGEGAAVYNSTTNVLSFSPLKHKMGSLYNSSVPKQTSHKIQSTFGAWRKASRGQTRHEMEMERKTIMEQLIALQQLKKQAATPSTGSTHYSRFRLGKKKKKLDSVDSSILPTSSSLSGPLPLGYALVTGASRGIGRALAVELARYEIPLILVARDLERLTQVAIEIETCYGVKCCVLQADLSQPAAASQVYSTTKEAGLHVDILVNNAGVCYSGETVDMSYGDVSQMVQVNAVSVATLSHLYGKDMKKQKRGRILFVSSITGATPSGPSVATYAATKAFEKSLALSMGRELEIYGVGVTCLLPGAVKGTDFATVSKSQDAMCWKYPWYAMTAPKVANRGIRAMLAGDSEVYPGWQNRVFLKGVAPLLPQRLITLIVEFSFRSLSSSKESKLPSTTPSSSFETNTVPSSTMTPLSPSRLSMETKRPLTMPPRLLLLQQDNDEDEKDKKEGDKRSNPGDVEVAAESVMDGETVPFVTSTPQSK